MPFHWILPLLALSLLALAATCGVGCVTTYDSSFGGIRGYVTIGPTCPVVQEESPCPDAPYVASIFIRDEDGDLVRRVTSGEDGRFVSGQLRGGTYTLVPLSPNAGAPAQASQQQVEVVAGKDTEVLIQYDSGIR